MKVIKVTGKVKSFNATKGYGFITIDNQSKDVFVHQSSVVAGGFKALRAGDRVEFEITDEKGLQATNVRPAHAG